MVWLSVACYTVPVGEGNFDDLLLYLLDDDALRIPIIDSPKINYIISVDWIYFFTVWINCWLYKVFIISRVVWI